MGVFFCIILFMFISMGDGLTQIYKNEKRIEDNKIKAENSKQTYYFDYNSKMRFLSNNKSIYTKQNNMGDICYYDCVTHQLIYNESKEKRKKIKSNIIKKAQINNLKYFEMPYVYKTKDGKDNNWCLSEIVETKTFQPFQIKYIPIKGYGFVMRKAPAINPDKLYDYNYKFDESKWGKWHVIDKKKYIEMTGKPIYEYEQLYYYNLDEIIKD